jgi:hypothetical protein
MTKRRDLEILKLTKIAKQHSIFKLETKENYEQ